MAAKEYVVYHVASSMEKKALKSGAMALAMAEKLGPGYAAASRAYYEANVVKMVERVNLMSGKKFMEASNRPGYLSPASEAYWSM